MEHSELITIEDLAQRILDFWTPERFEIGSLATDKDSFTVPFDSPEAEKFCIFGVTKRLGRDYPITKDKLLDELVNLTPGVSGTASLMLFNDTVVDAYGKLIDTLKDIAQGA